VPVAGCSLSMRISRQTSPSLILEWRVTEAGRSAWPCSIRSRSNHFGTSALPGSRPGSCRAGSCEGDGGYCRPSRPRHSGQLRRDHGRVWRIRPVSHFAERHGLIVIIALGEPIASIGVGVVGVPIS